MKLPPLVSIIILNWNGGEILKDCLTSLSKITYPNWELILVDNGSTDGSEKQIKLTKAAKHTLLIKNKKNLGFAEGNNQGFKKTKGKYILLLNNDTKVEKNFLTILLERLEPDENLGAIQPKILIMDKPSHLDSIGSFLTRTGFLQHDGFLAKDSKQFNHEKYVFSAKGACMLVKREVIEKVGLFDKEFGSYFEETDFCWRVWLAGYKILYYPKTHVYHKVGFTSKQFSQIDVNYHSFKNRIASLFKNLGALNLVTIGGTHLAILMGLSVYFLLTFRFKEAGIVTKAILWNIQNLPGLTEKRRGVQARRKIDDKELFQTILKPFDYSSMFRHFLRAQKVLGGEHEV